VTEYLQLMKNKNLFEKKIQMNKKRPMGLTPYLRMKTFLRNLSCGPNGLKSPIQEYNGNRFIWTSFDLEKCFFNI